MKLLNLTTTLLLAFVFALPGFSAITLTNSSLTPAVQGTLYSSNLSAIGGTSPYSFTQPSGVLPSGMSVSSTGIISGTPATAGTYSFTVRVTDATSAFAEVPLVLLVTANSGLQIVTASLPQGQVGTSYDASLTATGGSPPYSWNLEAGSGILPNGLTLVSTGRILQTPTTVGPFSFTMRVTDSNGAFALANYTIRINSSVLNIGTTLLPNGSLGAFYSQPLSITGGVQPYSISVIIGPLSPGLSLSSSGVISGTPTAIGTSNFTISVSDAINSQFSRALSITIGAAQFAFNQTPLPTGQVGSAYSATVTAAGGTSPYVITILSGVLPTGISFSNGVFSGTPTISGNFPLTLQARDNTNATVTANFSLVINSTTLVLTTSTLPNAIVNQSYSTTISANGGQQPYNFSLVAGQLPTGFGLSSSGSLSGISSTGGNFQFTVRVTDGAGAVTQAQYQLTVSTSNLVFVSTALPNAQVNQTYNASLSASGGTSPYLFTIIGGALPQGLTLGATGSISGVPTIAGNYQVTFRVQDSLQNTAQSTITLVVNAFGFRITTPFLASAQLGTPYSGNITAEGGSTPYVFFLLSGQLPPGLNLNFNGVISGTPTVGGNYAFTVRALDSASLSTESNFTLSVNSSGIGLSNPVLPSAPLNQAYSTTLTATGGTAPYTFSVVSGGLPAGINFNQSGQLSGTPTVSGTFNFAVQVRDNTNATSIFNLSLVVSSSSIAITTVSLPAATVGALYSAPVSVINGVAPFSFTLNGGSLPSGLNLSSSGTISGTPNVNGNFSFTVRVTDAQSGTATANLSIQVNGSGNLTITTTSLPGAQINQLYNALVNVSGGVLPYVITIIGGQLPPGLSLLSSGAISGTPTLGGNYTFIIRVVDGFGSATQESLSINVNSSGLSITTNAIPNGQLGQFFTTQLAATGGQAPYTWTVVSGTLPVGVTLNSQGILSGLPSTGGGFEVVIRVTDTSGFTSQKTFNFIVGSTFLSFITSTLPQAFIGQQYSLQLQVSGGAAPYVFSVLSGTLPNGLSLTSGGLLFGTPTATSFASLTFRVTDATSATAQVSLNLAVGQSTLLFSSNNIPSAAIGQNYNTALVVSGGTTPYTFSVSSGNLPTGIVLSPAGVLAGTATVAGIYTFTVRVQDSSNAVAFQSFSLNVLASSLQITTTTLPGGRVNQAYLQTIQTAGGVLPIRIEVISTINSGFLPTGLTLSLGGVLSGTPQATGSFTFSVRATDNQNLVTQATYTVVIAGAAPVITTTTLPAGTAGQTYSQSISASGGTPPYTFSQVSGNLPPSLTFSPSGILSGNANTPGTYTFTVRVNDSANQSTDATFTIEISSGATSLAISALAPPPGLLYFPYNFSLSATGGRQPYTWSIPLGPIPNGLRLDANGVLNGLLLAPGIYRFTARVSDANGTSADTSIAITVAGSTRLAQARVGVAYSAQVPPPIAGRPPFTYAVNANALGDLPVGLSLSPDGGISGTPATAGDFTFGILIRDASGSSSNASVTVPVVPAPGLSIVTLSLPGGATGSAYSQTLAATGGRPPYTWAVSSGTVPNGLNLNPLSGQISGTPTIQGTGFFVVRVSDSAGSTASSYFGISIGAAGSPVLNAITSAASYGSNGVVPGELIVVFGSPLGPQTLTSFSLVNNEVPTQLGGTRVLFDGVAAPLIYTLTGQVSAIAPYSLEGRASTRVVVEYLGFQSTPFLMPVLGSKPALFTVDGSGQGPGALLNQNGSVNTQNNRAARESVIVLYATGAGAMTPAGQAGRVAAGISSLNQQTLVTINGSPAVVLYAGNAPGLVEGVVQINVKMPFNTVPGQNSISVQIGAVATTSNVTVWVE